MCRVDSSQNIFQIGLGIFAVLFATGDQVQKNRQIFSAGFVTVENLAKTSVPLKDLFRDFA